jgi:transposase
MKKITTFVAIDEHKMTSVIAFADTKSIEVRLYGEIDNTPEALDKVVKKLESQNRTLQFVYEAGPCGYQTYRHLASKGYECMVAAPSLIPKKSGDRIKNDRRDAVNLARLFRAGELTAVHVPDATDEAMRDLVRARTDSKIAERKAKQQLGAFLLRSGLRYDGKVAWTATHFRWLATLAFNQPAQQIVFQEYVNAIQETDQRVGRLTEQIKKLIPDWSLAPVVKAIQALRGVSLIVAVTTVAELGDIAKRFTHPKLLMAYLGLIPSEHSSGGSIHRGGITKTGNQHVRRALVEGAWAYRASARVSKKIFERHLGLPPAVCEIAWKAQVRLCDRYRHLMARGKKKQQVIVAIARELAAFIWAIAQIVPVPVKP